MSRNNNPIGLIVGLLIFAYFGFVLLFPNMGFFPMFKVFPSFFIIIFIVSLATITSNKRRSTVNRAFKNENQVNNQNINPYRVENESVEHLKTSYHQRDEEVIEENPTFRFCQFCGTKIERDAMFCHSCGSKLK